MSFQNIVTFSYFLYHHDNSLVDIWLFFVFTVRLIDSNGRVSDTQGDIEIFDKVYSRWRAMCDDGWNFRAATVVCRQLNLGPPISIYSRSTGRFGYDYGIESVICDGTESNIAKCNYTTDHDCYRNESAGVICSPSKCSHRITKLELIIAK